MTHRNHKELSSGAELAANRQWYALYILRESYLWHLESVAATKAEAEIDASVQKKFDRETLIVGPRKSFPEWLET